MTKDPETPTPSAKGRGKRPRLEVNSSVRFGTFLSIHTDLCQNINEKEDSAVDLESSQPGDSTPMTNSTKEKSQTNNTRNQRRALRLHMMYLDEEGADKRNTDFIAHVRAILKGDRSSEKSDRSIKEIQKAQRINRVAMENTYVSSVLHQMIGRSRTVKIDHDPSGKHHMSDVDIDQLLPNSSNPDVVKQIKTVVRDFADDRLHWEGPCYFVKELITGPRTVKIFGIKDPMPDVGFGIREKGLVFNAPKVSDDTMNHIHAAGPLDFCFFIIEDKGPDGPFAHAVTQAIRGGATLVRVMRELRRRAGYEISGMGADYDTFVFTCAWEDGLADIYVSWQEVLPEGEVTHMTWLESYALRKEQDIKEFCRDLHNILDWGIDPTRIEKLEQMVRDIEKKEAAGLV